MKVSSVSHLRHGSCTLSLRKLFLFMVERQKVEMISVSNIEVEMR